MKPSLAIGLAALLAIVVAGVALVSLSGRGDDSAKSDLASDGVQAESLQADDPESNTGPGDDSMESNISETDKNSDDGQSERDPDLEDAPPVSGPTTTAGTASPTTARQLTTDTVEANSVDPETEEAETSDREDDANSETQDDPEGNENSGQGNDDPDPDNTVPTVPPNTDGTCRLSMSDLDGQSGVVELASAGTCAAVGVTIQGVNPRDDLADIRWGRDIEICRRHPAAEGIEVGAATGGGTIDLATGLSRDSGDAAIDALVISFADQVRPITGPRPIATCRTSTAELSIVHQPVG